MKEKFTPKQISIMHRVAEIYRHPDILHTRSNFKKILDNLEEYEEEIQKDPNYSVNK